eukprot:gene1100-1238_t
MELNNAILKSLKNAVSGQKKSLIGSASLSVKKSESLKSRFKQKTLESDVDGEEYEEKSLINDIDGELQSAERTAAQRTFYKSLDERFGGEGESRAYLDQEAVNIDGDINSGKFSQPEKEGVCICQRCYRLQQYGQVEQSLRPGWSSHELLTPERFETLLGSIRDNQAVVLCLVDIFDLQGSLLKNLRTIAGKNPVVIAANKVDLLPKDVSLTRLNDWVYRAVKDHCSFLSPRELKEDSAADWSRYRGAGPGGNSKPPSRFETAEDVTNRIRQKRFSKALEQDEEGVLRKSNVHLVSCESGYGMTSLVDSLMAMAKDNGNRVYVMGAANVGKSSFINRMLSGGPSGRSTHKKKGGTNLTPLATVSNLPGTTLDFLKMRLPNGVTMFDTPGLIQRGQLTSRVTTAELKKIIPSKPINAVTIRLEEGKCVLIGGLARVELAKGLPFFFTFFVSNEIRLHPTDAARADEFIKKHTGKLVFPPDTFERVEELGPYETIEFEIQGEGWLKSRQDIVISGLGWLSVTGSGQCKVRVTVPSGTSVAVRPSLMPYEAQHNTAKFTGGRLVKKGKSSSY